MAKKREKKPKAQKLKKVPYRFLPRAEHEAIYELLDAIVEAHHEDLRDAKIALLFNNAWQPDVDGNRRLVQARLVNEFARELADDVEGFDLAIEIYEQFWTDESVTAEKRRAVLDHALCYFDARRDKSLEHELNERGRRLYRLASSQSGSSRKSSSGMAAISISSSNYSSRWTARARRRMRPGLAISRCATSSQPPAPRFRSRSSRPGRRTSGERPGRGPWCARTASAR